MYLDEGNDKAKNAQFNNMRMKFLEENYEKPTASQFNGLKF